MYATFWTQHNLPIVLKSAEGLGFSICKQSVGVPSEQCSYAMLFIQVFNTLLWTESCQVATLHPPSATSPVIRREARPRDILTTTWHSVFSTTAWWHNSTSYLSLLYHGASPLSARFCTVTLVSSQACLFVPFCFRITIHINGNDRDVLSDISVKLRICKSALFFSDKFLLHSLQSRCGDTVSSKYCLYS